MPLFAGKDNLRQNCCVFRVSSLQAIAGAALVAAMPNGGPAVAKPTCDHCFFHHHMLCAVSQAGPCPTFRPNRPGGLQPPRQLSLNFRHERRLQVAWAFPSASEQVALHA